MPYNKSLYTYPFGSVSLENLNIHLTLNISKIELLIPTSLKPVPLVCNVHSYPFHFMAILSFQLINLKPQCNPWLPLLLLCSLYMICQKILMILCFYLYLTSIFNMIKIYSIGLTSLMRVEMIYKSIIKSFLYHAWERNSNIIWLQKNTKSQ